MELRYKICKIESGGCGQLLALTEDNFYYQNKEKTRFQTLCKVCENRKSTLWQKNHRALCTQRTMAALRALAPQQRWARDSVQGHKRSGYTVKFTTIELTAIALKTNNCNFCDAKLDWSRDKKKMNRASPTVDNLNLKNELSLDDILIICLKCNATKGHRTFEEYIKFCEMVVSKFVLKEE